MAEQLRQPGGPDPKPRPRHVDSRAGVAKATREGRCRLCHSRPHQLHRHHIVPRAQRGDDLADNIMPVCNDCHHLIHFTDDHEIRCLVRASLTADEYAYVLGKMGAGWLDANYPRRAKLRKPRVKPGGR